MLGEEEESSHRCNLPQCEVRAATNWLAFGCNVLHVIIDTTTIITTAYGVMARIEDAVKDAEYAARKTEIALSRETR